jgi:hypothetical protein
MPSILKPDTKALVFLAIGYLVLPRLIGKFAARA